jgi:glycosyltransferase involved in cell wall biosynthesis
MIAPSKNVLINLSNLHNGGAIQVAVSYVQELSIIEKLPFTISLIVSNEIHNNLQEINCDLSSFEKYEVFNSYGFLTIFSSLWRRACEVDVVFTLFGPLYCFPFRAVSIVGFAQPWIIYPDNEVYNSLGFFKKKILKLKFQIQRYFFSHADQLVVELEHVKNQLVEICSFDSEKIEVVHNCLNSIYFMPSRWVDLDLNVSKNIFNIGIICRDYPHKNTNVLPKIKQVLKDLYGFNVDFYVTFNELEWRSKSIFFRKNIKNVGAISVAQCPSFYKQMNAVIFPSYLECFSATPLEAMFTKKPLFASDRNFVRDVCGDFAYYFEPDDPFSAAEAIARYLQEENSSDQQKLLSASRHVMESFNPSFRAREYLRIIQTSLNVTN